MTPREKGKDLIINWDLLDHFNSSNDLWIDFNGLGMQHKRLWERKEYAHNQTNNIASNFYPITSAIAIKDSNSSKQVTVMTDRAVGGSAGMRSQSNIEIMHNRRINGHDAYGITEHLNDLDD